MKKKADKIEKTDKIEGNEKEFTGADISWEELTEMQQQFVYYYLQVFNATKAAIAAGYSEATAKQAGSKNRIKLSHIIDAKFAEICQTMDVDAAYVIGKLRKHAESEDLKV